MNKTELDTFWNERKKAAREAREETKKNTPNIRFTPLQWLRWLIGRRPGTIWWIGPNPKHVCRLCGHDYNMHGSTIAGQRLGIPKKIWHLVCPSRVPLGTIHSHWLFRWIPFDWAVRWTNF